MDIKFYYDNIFKQKNELLSLLKQMILREFTRVFAIITDASSSTE